MGFSYGKPSDMESTANSVNKVCKLHGVIQKVNDGASPSGKAVDGMSIVVQVLASNEVDQVGRTISDTFFNPKPDAKETAIKFIAQRFFTLFVAADLEKPDQFGEGDGEVELDDLINRQITCETEKDGEYFRIKALTIYHVDDPRSKDVPKDETALAKVPQQFRHPASYFEPLQPKKKLATAGAAAGKKVDTSDL